ncbi:SusD family protein [Pedobacter hartonius]|uniref:SusD family protein n=1 Tax=Pedobacter hartonius TaxID=425514 RepID=A0A1H3XFS5_9SPHI|nr:SusD family protein [Pedobacter hartonius]
MPQFIDTFDPDDSRLKDDFVQGQQYTSSGGMILCTFGANNGQPLKYVNEVPGVDSSEEVHGYRLGKFEYKKGALVGLGNDFPLLRYADVLMMKAEALLRTGDAEGATTLVTQVRQTSFSSNPAKTTVTAAQLMLGSAYDYGLRNHLRTTAEGGTDIQYGRFLDELGWEFTTEGRRRKDIAADPEKRDLENPNLKQNAGY